jgi:hypothetical protein
MKTVRISLLGIAALMFAGLFQLSAAEGLEWDRYENARFGYSVLYPAGLFGSGKVSENGDGSTFTSADGRSKLTVFAAYNHENMGIEEYRATILNKFSGYDKLDYGPARGSWFVLSGERDDNVYYQKVLFSCGGRVINAFALTYPVEQKRAFDAIVTGIEKNFRSASGRACEAAGSR